MKTGFVILHYQNIEVTQKCMDCLMKLHGIENSKIIIVDNASPNESGMFLKDKYKNYSYINVLINNQNGGFAKGNNLGYTEAIAYGCDTVVVMNNDVYIEDVNFIESLSEACRTHDNIDIIAPEIWALKGFYQNPLARKCKTKKEVSIWLCRLKTTYVLLEIPFLNSIVGRKILASREKKEKEKRSEINHNIREEMIGVVPHGACVIFTGSWTKNEEFAFVPKTFLYAEEYLLALYAQKNGYKIAYIPQIGVTHEAGASTKVNSASMVPKLLFGYKNEIQSVKELKKMYRD